jgi:hypothetical protein
MMVSKKDKTAVDLGVMVMEAEKFDKVFYGGILIGLIVFIAGILTSYWHTTGLAESRLILCVGLGILLGTFGSTGIIKYRNITITGVAAIAIVLSYVVVSMSNKQAKNLCIGTLTGDIKNAQIEIIGDQGQTLLGAKREMGRQYVFVVDGPINRPVFDVIITFPPNPLTGSEGTEIDFDGIDNKFINSVIGSGEQIEWRFNRKKETIKDYKGQMIARIRLPKLSSSRKPRKKVDWFIIKKAFAEDSSKSLQDIYVDLASGSGEVRRVARNDLAERGPKAIPSMMHEYRKNQNIYQLRLGILIAMRKMLKNNKALAPQISRQLSTEDLKLIVKSLTDNDRSIRIYAGEFLHDLGDPRVVPLALKSIKTEKNLEGVYLSYLVIAGAYPHLSESQKKLTNEQLGESFDYSKNRFDPKQQKVLNKLIGDIITQSIKLLP